MALDCCGGYPKEELVCVLIFYLLSVLTFIFFILVHSALVLDSYTHDQNKLEPYSIQAVKDIEAFLQIVLRSVTLSPHPYKVYTIMHYLCMLVQCYNYIGTTANCHWK